MNKITLPALTACLLISSSGHCEWFNAGLLNWPPAPPRTQTTPPPTTQVNTSPTKEVPAVAATKIPCHPQECPEEAEIPDIHYVQAITTIVQTLHPLIVGTGRSSPFYDWPTPNEYYYVSPSALYLETWTWRCVVGCAHPDAEILERLYTPFGEIKLSGPHWLDDQASYSTKFLQAMKSHWTLRDVSNESISYRGHRKEPHPFPKELWAGSGAKSHYYLIEEMDGQPLTSEKNQQTIYPWGSSAKVATLHLPSLLAQEAP